MAPDHILAEFQNKTNLKLGPALPISRQVVHTLQGYPGRVVKIDCHVANLNKFMVLLDRINRARVVPTVKIYQYGRLSGKYYYYVMNKLTPVPYSEFNSFYRKLCKWADRNDNIYSPHFNWRDPKWTPKTRQFFYQTKTLADRYGYHFGDLHEGNVMKTRKGEYRFIDLESFV